jgi:CRISPR-associated protein Csm5
MNPFASYRLFITPLSPVHIGTGESYEPTNYVIDDGVLHEFDTGAVMATLSDVDRKTLLEIGNRRPDKAMIEALQRYFYERRLPLMAVAQRRTPVVAGVERLYEKRMKGEAENRHDLNKMEIDRTAFVPGKGYPVLFGSSLKGAIRTALLNACNGQASLNQQEQRPFDDYSRAYQQVDRGEMRRAEKQMRRSAPLMQQRLFRFSPGQFQLDPFRLLSLSDASWVGESEVPATQARLAVNRKKAPVVDAQGALRKSKADELYQLLECIPGWHYRAFAGQITVQSVAGLDHRHNDKLPAANLRFELRRVAQACNAFYRPILDEERCQLRDRGYLDTHWDNTLQTLLQGQAERFERGELFLLRVGRHSGAESVTLNGVRHIKIMKAHGQPAEYLDTPKTWWLAAEDKDQMQNLLPFGWLLVEVHPLEDAIPDWHPLKEACAPYLDKARKIKDKLDAQQARLAQTRAQAEAKRREDEEKARHEAELAAQHEREEAERQARLQYMTENMRRIETFKSDMQAHAEGLRGRKDRPNTKYHDHARALARAALEDGNWTPEEKRAAADAIQEWLPKVIAVEMKEERKKLKLRELMGEA